MVREFVESILLKYGGNTLAGIEFASGRNLLFENLSRNEV